MGSDQSTALPVTMPIKISIHAPRVGSDIFRYKRSNMTSNFNPRSPCGERPKKVLLPQPGKPFQSTLPVWGATLTLDLEEDISTISIHAPRVGSDWLMIFCMCQIGNFNPRSPCGERPKVKTLPLFLSHFNPRSPCGERLQKQRKNFVFLPKTDTKFPYLLRFYSKKLNLQEKERKFQQNNGAKLLNDL